MSNAPSLMACNVRNGNIIPHVEIATCNDTGRDLGPGGMRYLATSGDDDTVKGSAPWLWPITAGETVVIVGQLPLVTKMTAITQIAAITYGEFSGTSREFAIDGSATLRMLGGSRIDTKG